MARSREGARIVYVPGNHDRFFRRHYGVYFDRIEVVEEAVHTAADGRRYLVTHGDSCDIFATKARWALQVGSQLDGAVRGLDALINRVRRGSGCRERADPGTVARVNRLIRTPTVSRSG